MVGGGDEGRTMMYISFAEREKGGGVRGETGERQANWSD